MDAVSSKQDQTARMCRLILLYTFAKSEEEGKAIRMCRQIFLCAVLKINLRSRIKE